MTISKNFPLTFKYLNLLPFGARGGVTRFFLLSQDIPFEENLFRMGDEWATEKKRLIETGENPSGSAPILYSNGNPHPQHIAAARYVAKVFEVTSGDDYKDYVQDLVADEYQGFRDHWVKVTFSGTDEDKASYKKDDLVRYLTKFDALYENFKTDVTFLSLGAATGQPLWGDAAVYGLLRDHILTGYIVEDELKPYSNLSDMYQKYEKIPAIQNWIAKLGSENQK
eukprot:scaffold34601_cov234-Amphora_coffeaeformis.AAC.19